MKKKKGFQKVIFRFLGYVLVQRYLTGNDTLYAARDLTLGNQLNNDSIYIYQINE